MGAGASLLAFLHHLAKHGSDRLLISHGHRSDDRSELGPGRVWLSLIGSFLEDAPHAIQQPLEIYAVLLGEVIQCYNIEFTMKRLREPKVRHETYR
jgi:hypothetical protein